MGAYGRMAGHCRDVRYTLAYLTLPSASYAPCAELPFLTLREVAPEAARTTHWLKRPMGPVARLLPWQPDQSCPYGV